MNIDFDKAWSSLKPELDKEQARREKKKRRFIIFFWSTAIFIGIGAGILVRHNSGNKSNELANSGTDNTKNFSDIDKRELNKEAIKSDANSNNQKILHDGKKELHDATNFAHSQHNLTHSKKNVAHNQHNLTHSKKNVARSQHNLAHSQHNLTHSIKNVAHSIKNVAQSNEDLTQNQSAMVKVENNTLSQNNNQTQTGNQKQSSSKETTKTEVKLENKAATVTTAQSTAKNQEKTKQKHQTPNNKWSYGLQLNAPLVKAYNVLDANSEKSIYTAFIPTVWVSKSFSNKSAALLFVNPYSNYYASSKAVASTESYKATTQQASQQSADQSVYTQTLAFNKLIGIEAGVVYQYQIKPKLFIGTGLSSFFTQSVLLQNKVVKNNKNTVTDNIYSVAQSDDEWKYIQQNFVLAQFEMSYSFKHINAGFKFIKPITNVFSNVEVNKTPVNTNLFVRWRF